MDEGPTPENLEELPVTGDEEDGSHPGRAKEVEIPAGPLHLAGQLTIPEEAAGIVVFAHGSGSSRHSPRNRFVSGVLNRAGLGTLLVDLLTLDEESDRTNVFDIELLASRLVDVTRWLTARPEAHNTATGYFGASTGAGAALWAAAEPEVKIGAVVSRGGRPDLAAQRLVDVTAATLLIVGSEDKIVLDLNRAAQARMRCVNHLAVVPGATHLFEEPDTLRQAAELARDWFLGHLPTTKRRLPDKAGNERLWPDPSVGRAREEATGVELYEDPFAAEALLTEREEAQGVEVFVNPDTVIPATALREGSPGHETLVGDQAAPGQDDEEEDRERAGDEFDR